MASQAIYVDALRLTSVGEQAVSTANAGGIVVKPVAFKVGDFTGSQPSAVPSQLLGNELASGQLSFVQVESENSARFVFDVSLDYKNNEEIKSIGEILIMLEDNRAFGHVVLSNPIMVVPNSAARISLLVHLKQDIQRILDVTMYDYATIPSVATLENLPASNDNHFNAVSVLDLHVNSDGSRSPGTAFRYGPGGYNWGFGEHDRVLSKVIGADFINANTFNTSLKLAQDEIVLVQTISGPGAGACRHFKYRNGQLINQDKAIPFISSATTIAVWKRIVNPIVPTAGIPWPEDNDVPAAWALFRGEGNKLYWGPIAGGNRQTTATLFTPPGKLLFSSLVTTGSTDAITYALSEELDSATDLLLGTSGVLQPRTAYEVRKKEMALSENLPNAMTLDLRQFRLEPSQGHVVLFEAYDFTGDGQTSDFKLGNAPVDDADHVFAVVGNTWQPTTVYKLNNGNRLKFVDSIPSGHKVSLYAARYEERAGWSTRIRVATFKLPYATDTFELPITPLNKAHVIANMGGLPAHTSDFTLVGSTIRFSTQVKANTTVEFTIFENVKSVGSKDTNIEGVIVDVIATPTGYMFKRQGMTPLSVPLFTPDIIAGKGIKIEGVWPFVKIHSIAAMAEAEDPKAIFNIQNRVEDSEEIIIRQRIEFNKGVVITATADFQAQLGPGFAVAIGNEHIEFVLASASPGSDAPEYGRGVKGTGAAGLAVVNPNSTESIAYGNASITQMYDLIRDNHPAGYVEIVAKMRISNAMIGNYASKLIANLCIKVEPR
ncbi:hypothetical protein JA33_097 [Dickeya phage vB_DsoM_JA33]|uniref:Uncharacterized protein n=3 Tax=Salmondvirus JA11 TaxID=2734141 RepID=A0A384ZW87_9CAUD|nr:hypothetical protein HOU32_gp097 [Dickeya phage vB_DsoM_JA11]AXG66501.1 hypothetical protein JA13_098 [Dickeya phage vB_DsoM_JA13]AXG67471.1 hypothetical protein JA33_097 [Dickeya phage vB_DsoM_JA33]AYD79902.1 hypothetical protein JA11_097 [Dickeya phage vB_DsoM_JA11]